MNVDTVNRWLALAANVGVLIGIAFLIVEINQNTQATNTASRDASVGHILNFFEQGMDNQVIARAHHKFRSGEELDGFERRQLYNYQYYNFKIFENIHIQYEQGLFSDSEWSKYRRIIKYVLDGNEIALEMWNSRQGHWTDGFEAEVAALLQDR